MCMWVISVGLCPAASITEIGLVLCKELRVQACIIKIGLALDESWVQARIIKIGLALNEHQEQAHIIKIGGFVLDEHQT